MELHAGLLEDRDRVAGEVGVAEAAARIRAAQPGLEHPVGHSGRCRHDRFTGRHEARADTDEVIGRLAEVTGIAERGDGSLVDVEDPVPAAVRRRREGRQVPSRPAVDGVRRTWSAAARRTEERHAEAEHATVATGQPVPGPDVSRARRNGEQADAQRDNRRESSTAIRRPDRPVLRASCSPDQKPGCSHACMRKAPVRREPRRYAGRVAGKAFPGSGAVVAHQLWELAVGVQIPSPTRAPPTRGTRSVASSALPTTSAPDGATISYTTAEAGPL